MKQGSRLTVWALGGVLAGLILGIALHGNSAAWIPRFEAVLAPIGRVWLAALTFAVIPLVVSQVLVAIGGARRGAGIRKLGVKAVVLLLAMVLGAGLFALLVTPPLLSLYPVDPGLVAALRAATTIPPDILALANQGSQSLADWLVSLVPESLGAALSSRQLLPVLVMTLLFAGAVTQLPEGRRLPLLEVFEGVAAAMLVMVRWILLFTPVAVFAFAFQMSLHAGGGAGGILLAYALLASGVILAVTLMLYPLTAILGGVSIRRFAAAIAPAQLVGIATRSSIAALPAMIEASRDTLRQPPVASGFILPMAVSTFKLNPLVSSTVKLLFLSRVFGVPLSASTLGTFLLTMLVLSFASPGLPSTNMSRLPAYLAAGVPIEGFVILYVVEPIPDICKTIMNVTADLSVATILTRK